MALQVKYDFTETADQLGKALLQAAEDMVNEAANILSRTKVVAEGIRAQVEEQSKLLADMNDRLLQFGDTVVEAHDKFLNGGKSSEVADHGKDQG